MKDLDIASNFMFDTASFRCGTPFKVQMLLLPARVKSPDLKRAKR
jgi:hypothetical protein